MGAVSFMMTTEATSAQAAFDQLYNDAVFAHGHDSYSGTIATCSFRQCTVLAEKYSKAVHEKARKLVNQKFEDENVYKNCAYCYDLGVVYYEVMSIEKTVPKKTPVTWTQKYVVIDTGHLQEDIVFSANTKKECDLYIQEHIFDEPRTAMAIAKRPVPNPKPFGRDKDYLARYTVTYKKTNTKPKESAHKKIEVIHKYLFYGLAAE